jgi:hypothetical protein
VEHRIDRLERPALIEDDAIVEQAFSVEHRAGIVEVGEQVRRRGNSARLGAKFQEMLLADGAMLALQTAARSVLVPHRLQPALDLQPSGADLGGPLLLRQPIGGVAQGFVERRTAAIATGAVVRHLAKPERRQRLVRSGRTNVFIVRRVAACLDDEHRAVGAAEMPHVFDPVSQGLIAEHETAMAMLRGFLGLGNPHKRKNRAATHE